MMIGRSRGQTSVEVLLVVAFTLVVSLLIALPYLDNQEKTNVALHTKLALFPYLEKNSKLVKIVRIQPEVLSDGSGDVYVSIVTKGNWDSTVVSTPQTCRDICPQIDPTHFYPRVVLDWNHQVFPSNGIVKICGATPVICP